MRLWVKFQTQKQTRQTSVVNITSIVRNPGGSVRPGSLVRIDEEWWLCVLQRSPPRSLVRSAQVLKTLMADCKTETDKLMHVDVA